MTGRLLRRHELADQDIIEAIDFHNDALAYQASTKFLLNILRSWSIPPRATTEFIETPAFIRAGVFAFVGLFLYRAYGFQVGDVLLKARSLERLVAGRFAVHFFTS